MSDWIRPQPLDRCEEHRGDPAWIAEAWQHPEARVLRVDGEGRIDADASGLVLHPASDPYDDQRHFLLGLVDGGPIFATGVAQATTAMRGAADALSVVQVQVAFTAVGLIGWHSRAAFCPTCGAASRPVLGGLARRCPDCGTEDYPRSDPAVIMAVTDAEDRLLVGRQAAWPAGRYSVLAGFVEVGESLEQAVHREVGEEVGVELSEVRYLGSQSWPFPRSLMVAFAARAVGTELRPAPGEIEDAMWVTRDELQAQLDSADTTLPPKFSISRRMIDAWLDGELTPERVG